MTRTYAHNPKYQAASHCTGGRFSWLLVCAASIIWLTLGGTPRARAENGLQASFHAAAQKWDIPAGLLMAIGYVETRWEHQPGTPALDGGFGIMHLTIGETGTLTPAMVLTGHT